MADNVYNLKFTLSNGDVIDAGQITAPQGPKGDKGDSADIPYSSSTPVMDGVGSVGSANTVARGDHRHPSDTSRQEKLVSGTNIKTINGQSVLGSGDIPISGGSEYANTSEIVDNAITLTSTSTLDDLVTQILAQKTKVVRAPWNSNFQRIIPLPTLPGPPDEYYYVYFKVWSDYPLVDAGSNFQGRIDCFATSGSTGSNSNWDYRGYIIGAASKYFSGWVSEGNPYPVGAIYIAVATAGTFVENNPASCFGGTWAHIEEGKFLLSATPTELGDPAQQAYPAGSTGGSADAVVVRHGGHVRPSDVGFNSIATEDWEIAPNSSNSYFMDMNKVNPYGDRRTFTKESSGEVGFRTIYKGESGIGKNMPPYLAVCMWKRIA